MEEGEHVLEFEEDHNDDFNMAVLKMPGGHAHHHHHGHGAGAFEWAGVFEVSDNSHTWSMQKVDGAYADPSMRIVVFPTSDLNEEGIHASEEGAETMIEGDLHSRRGWRVHHLHIRRRLVLRAPRRNW